MTDLQSLPIFHSNEETALLDMGDGIACLQFRSKGNSVSTSVRTFLTEILDHDLYGFTGMVIGSQGKHFSVGANLANIKGYIDSGSFTALEQSVKAFQELNAYMRHSKKPVVAAPYRMALGGGLEVVLHSSLRVALSKSFLGLVEAGVGLLPGGGGTKCCALALQGLEGQALDAGLITMFDKLILGKVSKSAQDARDMAYLTARDIIVEREDQLLDVAKAMCLKLCQTGFAPIGMESAVLPGKAGYDMLLQHAGQMLEEGLLSPYDLEIGKKIAVVLCGSATEGPREYNEGEIITIEREGFLELTHAKGTYERIDHFLRTNEKLRNYG